MEPTQPLTVDLWTKTRLHTGHYQAATEAKKAIGASKSWDDAAKNQARAEVDKFFAADRDKAAPKSAKAAKAAPKSAPKIPVVAKTEDKKEEEDLKKAKQAGAEAAETMLGGAKDGRALEERLAAMRAARASQEAQEAKQAFGYGGASMVKDPQPAVFVTYQDLMQTAVMAKDMPGDTWGKIAERVAVLILARLN